jgi:twitching motility two-component system response regulator PilH
VVDDSPTEVRAIGELLEASGFATLAAHSAEEGVRLAREELPDVILMDIVMPDLSGDQATRRLGRDPRTAGIPVIMVSTKAEHTDRIWAARQGARGYLVKPVHPGLLVTAIRRVLGGAERRG